MSKPLYVVGIVGLIVVWKSFGYNMILYLAGLQTIPKDLYEAAQIDGANLGQRFLSITLPMLRPISMFVIVTTVIWGLQIFDEPALLMVGTDSSASISNTLGGPEKSVYTLVSYVYEEGFVLFRPGRSAAVAYLMTLVIITASWISIRLINKGEKA
jgi:multiple sugar transport system permease protein/cellobiose transport system permease protein